MPITQELDRRKFDVLIVCEGKADKVVVEMLCDSLGLLKDVSAFLTYSRGRASIAERISTMKGQMRHSKVLVVLADADEREFEEVVEELEKDLREHGLSVSLPRENPSLGKMNGVSLALVVMGLTCDAELHELGIRKHELEDHLVKAMLSLYPKQRQRIASAIAKKAPESGKEALRVALSCVRTTQA